MSQGENAYLVLRGVFHVSPQALGGLSIDGKLTFSNNAYLKLTTEWIMLHGELAAPLAPRLLRCADITESIRNAILDPKILKGDRPRRRRRSPEQMLAALKSRRKSSGSRRRA